MTEDTPRTGYESSTSALEDRRRAASLTREQVGRNLADARDKVLRALRDSDPQWRTLAHVHAAVREDAGEWETPSIDQVKHALTELVGMRLMQVQWDGYGHEYRIADSALETDHKTEETSVSILTPFNRRVLQAVHDARVCRHPKYGPEDQSLVTFESIVAVLTRADFAINRDHALDAVHALQRARYLTAEDHVHSRVKRTYYRLTAEGREALDLDREPESDADGESEHVKREGMGRAEESGRVLRAVHAAQERYGRAVTFRELVYLGESLGETLDNLVTDGLLNLYTHEPPAWELTHAGRVVVALLDEKREGAANVAPNPAQQPGAWFEGAVESPEPAQHLVRFEVRQDTPDTWSVRASGISAEAAARMAEAFQEPERGMVYPRRHSDGKPVVNITTPTGRPTDTL